MRINNKGFSMVELIIAMAIMSVVAGVFVLQVVKYVGEARQSTDEQVCSTINTCINTAMSNEDIWKDLEGWNKETFVFYIRKKNDGDEMVIRGLKKDTTTSKDIRQILSSIENPKVVGMESYEVVVEVDEINETDEEGNVVTTYAIGNIEVATSSYTFDSDSEQPIYQSTP